MGWGGVSIFRRFYGGEVEGDFLGVCWFSPWFREGYVEVCSWGRRWIEWINFIVFCVLHFLGVWTPPIPFPPLAFSRPTQQSSPRPFPLFLPLPPAPPTLPPSPHLFTPTPHTPTLPPPTRPPLSPLPSLSLFVGLPIGYVFGWRVLPPNQVSCIFC